MSRLRTLSARPRWRCYFKAPKIPSKSSLISVLHRLGTPRPPPIFWTRKGVGQDIQRLECLGRDVRINLKPENIYAVEELPNTRPRVRVIQRILRLEYLTRLAKIKLKSELISLVEEQLGYRFKDERKCLEALAFQFKNGNLCAVNNKRLALVGDAYLRLELLMAWYPSIQSTGLAAQMLSALASNARLTVLGRKIGLAREERRAGDIRVADTVEAIIGAIVLDGGREALPRVMQRFGFFDTSEIIVLYSQSKKRILKDDVTRGIEELQKRFSENDVR